MKHPFCTIQELWSPDSWSYASTTQEAWNSPTGLSSPIHEYFIHNANCLRPSKTIWETTIKPVLTPCSTQGRIFLWNPDWEAKPGLKPKVISLQFVLSSYVFLLNLLVTLALHDCTPYSSATRTECWPSLWWVWMCGKGGASCWHKWSPGISCWDSWGSLTPLFQNEKFQRLPGSALHG